MNERPKTIAALRASCYLLIHPKVPQVLTGTRQRHEQPGIRQLSLINGGTCEVPSQILRYWCFIVGFLTLEHTSGNYFKRVCSTGGHSASRLIIGICPTGDEPIVGPYTGDHPIGQLSRRKRALPLTHADIVISHCDDTEESVQELVIKLMETGASLFASVKIAVTPCSKAR